MQNLSKLVNVSNKALLPTAFGDFFMQIFQYQEKDHIAIFKDLEQFTSNNETIKNPTKKAIVRIHSECITGEAFHSLKCDCGFQLDQSLKKISENGGILIYLRQEGRDIGLFNKINAYALQDQGLDTIKANLALGFKIDHRSYELAEYILNFYKLSEIQLLTNNPDKLNAFQKIKVVKRLALQSQANKHNKAYLKIKKEQIGHLLD